MNKVYILVGNIASGKSTYALNLFRTLTNVIIINQDVLGSRDKCIREFKADFDQKYENLIAVIDRTNISRKQRAIWINLAKEFGAEVHIIEFLTRPEKCVERALARKNHLTIKNMSKERIKSIVNKFQNEYEKVSNEEGFTSYQFIIVDKPISFWEKLISLRNRYWRCNS